MKSGVGPKKYRRQTPIWASICTPVAPTLLISSGHSPRLGDTIFVWEARPRNAPRGAGSDLIARNFAKNRENLKRKLFLTVIACCLVVT